MKIYKYIVINVFCGNDKYVNMKTHLSFECWSDSFTNISIFNENDTQLLHKKPIYCDHVSAIMSSKCRTDYKCFHYKSRGVTTTQQYNSVLFFYISHGDIGAY